VKHEDVPSEDIIAAIQQGAQFFLTGSVDGQVKDYLKRDLVGGAVKQPNEVVYVIWGGANDYISKEPFTGDISTLLDQPDGKAGYRRIVNRAP
jgi:thermolabile hemolysin